MYLLTIENCCAGRQTDHHVPIMASSSAGRQAGRQSDCDASYQRYTTKTPTCRGVLHRRAPDRTIHPRVPLCLLLRSEPLLDRTGYDTRQTTC